MSTSPATISRDEADEKIGKALESIRALKSGGINDDTLPAIIERANGQIKPYYAAASLVTRHMVGDSLRAFRDQLPWLNEPVIAPPRVDSMGQSPS